MKRKYLKCSITILALFAGMVISASMTHAATTTVSSTVSNTDTKLASAQTIENSVSSLPAKQAQNEQTDNFSAITPANADASLTTEATNSTYQQAIVNTNAFVQNATPYNGWKQQSNDDLNYWTYYRNGQQITQEGWQWINGAWYYFLDGGRMAANEVVKDLRGNLYAFDNNGHYYINSRAIDPYFGDGTAFVYASANGILYGDGWHWINGNWYYLLNPGNGPEFPSIAQSGWQHLNGSWYYLDEYGCMLTGWQYINSFHSAWYYFQPGSGHMLTGWQYLNGHWYYLQLGSGHMLTGWQYLNGHWYYLQPGSGHMLTGWQYLNGRWYFFNGSGDAASGWRMINNKWYYFDPQNAWMVTGQQNINGKNYSFNASGAWED